MCVWGGGGGDWQGVGGVVNCSQKEEMMRHKKWQLTRNITKNTNNAIKYFKKLSER